jgi:hypothetical protein
MRAGADAEFHGVFDDVWELAYRTALSADRRGRCDRRNGRRVYTRWPGVSGQVRPWAVAVATNLALDRGRRIRAAQAHRADLAWLCTIVTTEA